MAATKKKRCGTCGGFCGGNGRRAGCKFAANEAKRHGDEMWAYAKAVAATQQEAKGDRDA